MYTREWTVRFSDADPFGIAFYPQIIREVHDTASRFLESIGWPIWELIDDHGIGLPIVDVNASFSRPLKAGEVVTIALQSELGESSVRFEYTGTVGSEEAFTAYEQRVCVPVDGNGAIALPDDFRTALQTATFE